MNIPNNEDRANRALDAVVFYSDVDSLTRLTGEALREEAATFISDLLCDIQHLCRRDGLDFEAALGNARGNFEEECSEED